MLCIFVLLSSLTTVFLYFYVFQPADGYGQKYSRDDRASEDKTFLNLENKVIQQHHRYNQNHANPLHGEGDLF